MSSAGTHAAGFDGTTGRSSHGGRRTHIIQLLRDTPEPVTVAQVATAVGVPPGTARAHLEALVDAGMACRTVQPRETPGRPRVVYDGVLPNQTHVRAQGYRLLSTLLVETTAAQAAAPGAASGAATLREVGASWGRRLVESDGPCPADDDERLHRLVATLDSLWFAPEIVETCCHAGGAEEGAPDPTATERRTRRLTTHHCPLRASLPDVGDAACAVHAGLVDGALAALGSPRRLLDLTRAPDAHRCTVTLGVPDLTLADHDRAGAPGRA